MVPGHLIVDMKESKHRPLSWFWGSLVAAIVTIAMGAGVAAVVLAICHGTGLAALVALSLSVFWGGVAAGLLALRFSARSIRAEMQVRVTESTIQHLMKELEKLNPRKPDSKDASQWAELIDRLDELASKALENSDRRA